MMWPIDVAKNRPKQVVSLNLFVKFVNKDFDVLAGSDVVFHVVYR